MKQTTNKKTFSYYISSNETKNRKNKYLKFKLFEIISLKQQQLQAH